MIGFLQFPTWLKPEIIPGLPLRWYGLMYLVSFVLAYVLFRYQVRERGLDVKDDDILNLFFWAILGLLVGARIFATTIYDPTGMYLRKPWLIFWPFDERMRFTGLAGMSYHGGLVGVVVAVVIYCRVKKFDVLEWGDMMVAGVPLGYTFGRLGNFINGELFGRVTASPIGMMFPHAAPVSLKYDEVRAIAGELGMSLTAGQTLVSLPRHPSQLYEALFEGVILWLVLWFGFRKRLAVKGAMISIYLIGYGLARFVIEYFREPDIGIGYPISFVDVENPTYLFITPWNFTTGQILCFIMIVAGCAVLPVLTARQRRIEAEAVERDGRQHGLRKLRKKIR